MGELPWRTLAPNIAKRHKRNKNERFTHKQQPQENNLIFSKLFVRETWRVSVFISLFIILSFLFRARSYKKKNNNVPVGFWFQFGARITDIKKKISKIKRKQTKCIWCKISEAIICEQLVGKFDPISALLKRCPLWRTIRTLLAEKWSKRGGGRTGGGV